MYSEGECDKLHQADNELLPPQRCNEVVVTAEIRRLRWSRSGGGGGYGGTSPHTEVNAEGIDHFEIV